MGSDSGRCAPGTATPIPLGVAVRTWAYVGVNSFGGPAGQIAVMHREVVERRRWVSERRFLHALNTCMLLPGPEAMQLATYLGWLMHGVRGGIIAGILFILPGAAVMLGLSIGFALFGSVPAVTAMLAGLQAAVVVLVVQALVRISRRAIRGPLLVTVAAASFIAVFALGIPFPVLVIASGIIGWLLVRSPAVADAASGGRARLQDDDPIPRMAARAARRAAACFLVLWLAPVGLLVLVLGPGSVLAQVAWLLSKAAVLTFGGAYAILGYVSQEAVGHYGWLTADQMAAGLGLAETTPGPLLLVLQFIGFMAAYGSPAGLDPVLAGTLGSAVAAWVIFVPAFMFVFFAAPVAERLRSSRAVVGALAAISAAVCGVILDLALWFAAHVLFESTRGLDWGPLEVQVPVLDTVRWPIVALVAVASVLVLRFPRLPTLGMLGACAGLSLAWSLGVALQA